uniref:FimV/HubP family polar landmark protein n=1 Tax=Chitinimonas sp. TaxID=1934313 RepID=UPI0035B3E801
ILKLPGKAAGDISQADAVKEIHAQAENWQSYRSKLASSTSSSQSPQGKDAGSGKIPAKIEDKASAKQADAPATLKLSKGDEAGKLKERVRSLEEDSTAKQKALAEASQRVAELQQTNKKLEELLALKSKQGAQAQKQAEAQNAAPKVEPKVDAKAAPAAKAPEPVKAAEPKPAPAKPAAEVKPAEVKPAEVKPVEKAPEPKPAEVNQLEAHPAEAAKPEAAAVPPAAATEVKPAQPDQQPHVEVPKPQPKPKKKPLPPPPPEPEPSLLDTLLLPVGGGLALLGLGGGAFWYSRRRRKNSFEDSIITGSDLKSNTMVGNTGGAVISTGVTENSFLTDFSRAGLGTIDTDEVDPIAEAEVYMAYGRDTQAEEILKDALARDGSRQEVRLKLLEIYNSRKNVSAFETLAQEMYSATQGNGPLWEQAADMGRTLDPQNNLYQRQEPVNTGSLDKTMVMSAGTLLGDTGQFNKPYSEPAVPEEDVGGDLDFQLDMPQASAEKAPAVAEVDFDLGMDEAPAAAPAAPVAAVVEPVGGDLAMDFDLGDLALPETSAPATAPQDDAGILSLDIPLDLATEAPAAPAAPAAVAVAELDTPDMAAGLDFDFDLSEPAAADAASLELDSVNLDLDIAPESSSGDVMDFGAELDDPVTTKIDLARAYIDMGDKEGAREILQEALGEGSAEQKATAESLLAQI